MGVILKNPRRLFSTTYDDGALSSRVTNLENNVYKITYYEIISGATGTLTVPTQATINAGEFSGLNCILSEIDGSNKPTFVTPKTGGGIAVTATLNTITGGWVKSGVTASANVALIYSVNISALYYSNLTDFYIINSEIEPDFNYVLNNSTVSNTTSALLLSIMSDPTGTGSLVFGTSPTFTTDITTPIVYGSSSASGNLSLYSTSNATKGSVIFPEAGTNGVKIQGFVGNTTLSALYLNQTTPSSTNYALRVTAVGGTITALNGESGLRLRVNDSDVAILQGNTHTWQPVTSASGAVTNFTFTKPNNTGQTASTAINGVLWTLGSREWATGAITTQKEFELTTPTYSFVGASTITNAYTLYVNAPTAGVNATITNNYALGTNGNVIFNDGTSKMIWRALPSVPTYSGIFLNETPAVTNAAIYGDGSGNTYVNGSNSVYIAKGATSIARFGGNYAFFTIADGGTSSNNPFKIAPATQTGGTASTEISTFLIDSYTRTWSTGAITNQRSAYIKTQTLAFAAASTVTNAYGLYVEAPTAGANATITNNFGLGVSGGTDLQGTVRIGTSTSKMFFRGAVNGHSYNRNPDTGVMTNSNAFGYQWNRVESVTDTADTLGLTVYNTAGTSVRAALFVDGRGYIGMGTSTPSTLLNVLGTTEQLRLSYDGSFYSSLVVNSAGGLSVVTNGISNNYCLAATNNYYTYFYGAFSGYMSYTSSGGGTLLTVACDTTTVISRGTQTSTTPILLVKRTENQLGMTMARFETGFLTSAGNRTNIGGTIEFYLSSQQGSATALTNRIRYIWDNDQDGTAGNKNSSFVFDTTRAGTLTESFRVGSVSLILADSYDITFNTTTGSKIGTATSQKIGFWNATPIVQPTTAGAAATFVANTSGIVDDSATFDGYTIGQIVKALRNTGLLA